MRNLNILKDVYAYFGSVQNELTKTYFKLFYQH